MRIVRTAERYRGELAELMCAAAAHRRKDEFGGVGFRSSATVDHDVEENDKAVCVTSGFSFVGRAIVKRLLINGYCVRIIVDNPEDAEKAKEMKISSEKKPAFNGTIEAVTAKLTHVESLTEAFDGCNGVFHTSAFIDPSGVSGYSKFMAEREAKVSERVMEACGRTQTVRKCVLTSSLLACVWRNGTQCELPTVVNHTSWSDESLCKDKKLWYALGKLKAEKAAWRIAEAKGLKLSTICPALITGLDFLNQNPTPTIAYLKGAQEMYANGLLAAVEVDTLAKAHVRVYEAMNKAAFGRYICYDGLITREGEAESLAKQTGTGVGKIRGDSTTPFRLSDRRLKCLLSRSLRSCYDEV